MKCVRKCAFVREGEVAVCERKSQRVCLCAWVCGCVCDSECVTGSVRERDSGCG